MWKIIIPFACVLGVVACKDHIPTDSAQNLGTSQPTDLASVGSIDIENEDLKILRKSHALSKSSGLRIKDAEAQELLAKYLAKALATSLKDQRVREVIKEQVGKKFDGDYNVLWSKIMTTTIGNYQLASKIRSEFSESAQKSGIMEMFEEFRRLQIAIPKNFEMWDVRQPIMVAWVPFRKDDLNTDYILAYDSNLKEIRIDGKKPPNYPVVVVSKNERTNNNEELMGGIYIDNGNGNLVLSETAQTPSGADQNPVPSGEAKFGYPSDKVVARPNALMKKAAFGATPKVPLYWDRVIVYSDLEGWFMGGMEIRLHMLADKENALTNQKEGVYEDNNYHVGSHLRNINEDISRYIGTKLMEIDDNDWDKNFTFKLSADIAKMFKGTDENGNAKGEIAYNFGGDTDDDYVGENNKIELGSQDVPTYWTNGVAKIKFNYDPGIVEYDISSMPYVSASGTQGRGNAWNISDANGNDVVDGEDVTYRLIVPQGETNTYKISTCDALTNFDTMIQVFDKDRGTPYMNDDDYSCPSNIWHSSVTAQLSGGTYYIIVDGYNGYVGSFKLSIQKI